MEVMAAIGGLRDTNDLVNRAQSGGLIPPMLQKMEAVLKGCKMKAIHLGYQKKFKAFGKYSYCITPNGGS